MITAVTTKKKRSDLSRFRRVLRPRQQLRCLAEFDEDELDFEYQKNNKVAVEGESENSGEKSKLKLVLKLPPISKASKVDVERHVSRPESSESASGSDTSASEEESEEDEIVKPLKKRRVERSRDLSCGSGQREEINMSTIRRPVRSASGTPMPKMSYLEAILDKLQMKDTFRVFAQPVNPEELPDYHDVIERPMDFGTVRKKLASRWYRTFEQFEDDVFLICSNAMKYNAPDTVYFNQAHSIQDTARSKFCEIRANQISNRGERKYEENIRPVHTQKNMEKNPHFVTAPKHSNCERSFVRKKLMKQNDCRNVLKPVGHGAISIEKKFQKTNFEKRHETLKVFPTAVEKDISKRPGDASYTEKLPKKHHYRLDPDTREVKSSQFSEKKLLRKPHFCIATAPRSSTSKKTQHRTDAKPLDTDIQFSQSSKTFKKDQPMSKRLDTNSHSIRKKPPHNPHSKPECIRSGVKIKPEDASYVGNTSLNKRQSKIDPESFGFDTFQEKKIQKQHQKRSEIEPLCLDYKQAKKPQFKSNLESCSHDVSSQANKIQKDQPNITVLESFGSEFRPLKKPQSKRDTESFGSDYRPLKKPQSKTDTESFGFDLSLKKCKNQTDHPNETLGLDYRSLKKPQSTREPEKKTEMDHVRTEPESLGSAYMAQKRTRSERDPESFGSYISSQDQKTQIVHPSQAEPGSLGSDDTSLKKPQAKKTQIDHPSGAALESLGSYNTSLKKPQSKGGSYVSSQDQKTQINHLSGAEPESLGSDNTPLKRPRSKGDPDSFGSSYTSLQEKKTQIEHVSRTEPESLGSDFSSAETPHTLTGLREIQAIEKASSCIGLITQENVACRTKLTKVDESIAAVNISAEASSLLDGERSASEDDVPGKISPSKHTQSSINRRATYKKIEEEPTSSTNHIFDVLEDGRRELVNVSPKSEHSYAKSLARFALSLGPVGWEMASQKIEQSLPADVKFGPGWIGEDDQPPVSPPIPSSQNITKHSNRTIIKPSLDTSKPYTNNICFGAERSFSQAGGWTQVQNGARKNTEKTSSQKWNQVPKKPQLIKVKAEPNTDDLPNTLPTAYANMKNLPFRSFSEINFSRTPQQFGAVSNWSPRINQQQAVNTVIRNSITAPTVQIQPAATAKWKRSVDTRRSVLEGVNTKREFSQGVLDNSAGLQNGRLFVFPDLNLNFQPPVSPTFASLDSQQPDLALQL